MIVGQDPTLAVSDADDDFHRPTSADPTWIETVWFPFWIPEEEISIYARIWFRPNAGEQGGAAAGVARIPGKIGGRHPSLLPAAHAFSGHASGALRSPTTRSTA